MSFNFYKGRVIERSVDLSFNDHHKNFMSATDLHVFIPWNKSRTPNLMYKIKSQLQKNGKSLVPFMNSDFSVSIMDMDHFQKMKEQISKRGREVHLVMSNKASIHILRVVNLHLRVDDTETSILNCFSEEKYSCYLEVDDLFVLEANHLDDDNIIEKRLRNFLVEGRVGSIFKPLINYNLQENLNCAKWINRERSLTYEYLVHSRELKNNIFHMDWDSLAIETQHELVNFELQKQKALGFRGEEKWYLLEKAFDAYEKSVLSELNDIYIVPIVNSLFRFESLAGAWKVTSESQTNRQDETIIKIFNGEQIEMNSIEEFIDYIKSAKSFYYSLKKHFTKKIHKEEFLIVENFLTKQEALVDSFHCKKLLEKLELILNIQSWIKKGGGQYFRVQEQNSRNLKLSHFLNILISTNFEENVFYHLIAEKVGRAVLKASLKEQVKALEEEHIKQSAS